MLNWCKFHKVWVLNKDGGVVSQGNIVGGNAGDSTSDLSEKELFVNSKINRRLKTDFILEIFKQMLEDKNADWYNQDILNNYQKKSNSSSWLVIYWKPLNQWAQLILDFVEATGNSGTIFTLQELTLSELVAEQEFYGIHPFVLHKALQVLVGQNRAQFMKDDNGLVAGVKIV